MSRVVLITGASRGIGAATARLAAERGDHVAVNYTRNTEAARAVVAECVALGTRAIAVQADVADEAAVIEMFDTVADALGPVDVLVNNAGILHTQMRFDEMPIDRWRQLLDVNVNAVRPGVIRTDIHASGGEPGRVERVAPSVPMQRGGDPIEVARTILWLASDEASYITAAIVNCSGGR
jgi:NAD(P)-dependent dehydrogenase (short-subunit alcohol dehydrogenase family)